MNNENKARWKKIRSIAYLSMAVMIFQNLFGISPTDALTVNPLVYNTNILYINKYNNLVNIKDIINIDIYNINNVNKRIRVNTSYLINDLHLGNKFLMPSYSKKLNLKSRVDTRVFISRIANAIKSQETGGAGAYLRKSYSSSACGAYQYMPTTWNNFMGYKNPCEAPAWVQDQKMLAELSFSWNKYHDWRKVVAAHMCPSWANNPRMWKHRIGGNPTINQYVESVFEKANIALV